MLTSTRCMLYELDSYQLFAVMYCNCKKNTLFYNIAHNHSLCPVFLPSCWECMHLSSFVRMMFNNRCSIISNSPQDVRAEPHSKCENLYCFRIILRSFFTSQRTANESTIILSGCCLRFDSKAQVTVHRYTNLGNIFHSVAMSRFLPTFVWCIDFQWLSNQLRDGQNKIVHCCLVDFVHFQIRMFFRERHSNSNAMTRNKKIVHDNGWWTIYTCHRIVHGLSELQTSTCLPISFGL